MDCYVGASTGAVKAINLKENTFHNLTTIKELNPKAHEVTAMTWNDDEQLEVLIARVDRQLKLFNTAEDVVRDLLVAEGGGGSIRGVTKFGERTVTGVESGMCKVWDDATGSSLAEFSVGPGLTTLNKAKSTDKIVTGGIKNVVKTWDVETGKNLWSAKNVAPDMLGLEVPIMCTDARFLDGNNTIVEATKIHEIRLYDTRTQRRPVQRFKFERNAITATSLCNRENHIIAATGIGEMALFDFRRTRNNLIHKLRGQTGSIRSIDGHAHSPLVASCGIDRFVRVHNLDTKKLVHKIYCKAKMNKILMRDTVSSMLEEVKKEELDEDDWDQIKKEQRSDGESDDDDDGDDSDVWDDIQQVDESDKSAKKHKNEQVDDPSAKKRKVEVRKKRRSESEEDDEIEVIEPKKKQKVDKGKKRKEEVVEVKDEIISDDEVVVQAPTKKKKKTKKA